MVSKSRAIAMASSLSFTESITPCLVSSVLAKVPTTQQVLNQYQCFHCSGVLTSLQVKTYPNIPSLPEQKLALVTNVGVFFECCPRSQSCENPISWYQIIVIHTKPPTLVSILLTFILMQYDITQVIFCSSFPFNKIRETCFLNCQAFKLQAETCCPNSIGAPFNVTHFSFL